jgi:hypothetical protein
MSETPIRVLRKRIMTSRGIKIAKSSLRTHKKLEAKISHVLFKEKTVLMRLLEQQHGMTIEDILTSGSLKYIEKTYHIDSTTASKWRKKLTEIALKQLGPDTVIPALLNLQGAENGGQKPGEPDKT